MAANPNWPRWISASVSKFLKDIAIANSIPSLVDGLEKRTTDLSQSDKAEIRVNGPYLREASKGFWVASVGVNVHLTVRMDGPNAYKLQNWCGIFLEAMSGNIPLLQLGDQSDTGAQFGCLRIEDSKDPIRVIHFGQVDKTDLVRQSVVDARYVVELGEA